MLLAEWGVPVLFHFLSLSDIIILITAALLEIPIFFFSESLGFLSATTFVHVGRASAYLPQHEFNTLTKAVHLARSSHIELAALLGGDYSSTKFLLS